jgi:surface protein
MVGTEASPFYGHFDGNGYSVEINIDSSSEVTAPFRYAGKSGSQTVIKNLVTLGNIKTSKKYAGGIIGYGKVSVKLEACQSFAEINSTVNGDGSHGGLIGLLDDGGTYAIEGCVFSGKLLGSETNAVGGFVGWMGNAALDISYSLFVPDEVTVSNKDSQTLVRYNPETTDISNSISNSYYVKHLGHAQGTKAYEIDNNDEYLTLEDKEPSRDYAGSLMYFSAPNDGGYRAMMVQVMVNVQRIFAESGATVNLSSVVSVTFKDEYGNDIPSTGSGTEAEPYQFAMPERNVLTEESGFIPYAIWCEGNKTLYFHSSDNPMGATYDGQTVTALWSGGNVVSTGWDDPGWSSIATYATKVVFTSNFANQRPKSLYHWFCDFIKMETIEGIENLNTSACTNFNSAFFNCNLLKKIDVDGFDASKVTNSTSMFYGCDALQTIFCNKAWTHIESSSKMFSYSSNLSGADSYNDNRVDASMANPNNGYFTKKELTLANSADNSAVIEKFSGIKNVEVTLAGRTLSKDGNWNTLCLPFDVTEADGTPLSGATIMELDTSSNLDSEGILTLNFTNASSIEAGKPYIVKWETQGEAVSNPEFTGVTVTSTSPEPIISTDTKVTFVGQYSPFTIVANGVELEENQGHLNEIILLSSGNRLGYSQHPRTLNCFRAHFYVPAENGATGVRSYALNFAGDGTTTGIIEILNDNGETTNDKSGTWFSIDGRKLSGKPTTSGLYINNGKKIIVK